MKLKDELPFVLSRIKEQEEKIIAYREELCKAGGYNSFEVRFANDVLRAVTGNKYLCSLYEKYDCHDTHITTLGITALKQLKII